MEKTVFHINGGYTATILDAKGVSEFMHAKLGSAAKVRPNLAGKYTEELSKLDAWLKTAAPGRHVTILETTTVTCAFRKTETKPKPNFNN